MTRDPARLMCRALICSAAGRIRIEDSTSVDWSSATFTGARHRVTLSGQSGAWFEAWRSGLPEAELPVSGSLVADLAIAGSRQRGDRTELVLEILTLDAA